MEAQQYMDIHLHLQCLLQLMLMHLELQLNQPTGPLIILVLQVLPCWARLMVVDGI